MFQKMFQEDRASVIFLDFIILKFMKKNIKNDFSNHNLNPRIQVTNIKKNGI